MVLPFLNGGTVILHFRMVVRKTKPGELLLLCPAFIILLFNECCLQALHSLLMLLLNRAA